MIKKYVHAFLVGLAILSISGCATMGTKLAYNLAQKEEAKGCEDSYQDGYEVDLETCERISSLIQKAGIPEGYVGYDKKGRIKLKGNYNTERDVDLAFTIAQTVVGTHALAVSPVTPRNIGEMELEELFQPTHQPGKKGNKHALLIGVSKFKNKVNPIETADDDVRYFKDTLKRYNYKVHTLIDEEATKSNILEKMRYMKDIAAKDDTIVFYLSTHGAQPDRMGQLQVIPYDFNPAGAKSAGENSSDDEIIDLAKKRLKAIKDTAISNDELQDFFVYMKEHSGEFIGVLDTCYSGAAIGKIFPPLGGEKYAAREEHVAFSMGQNQIGGFLGKPAGSKDLSIDSPDSTETRETPLPIKSTDAPEEAGFDWEQKTLLIPTPEKRAEKKGAVIITAASGNQTSNFLKGSKKVPNSFFTYYFLHGLNLLNGQVEKAFEYAQERTNQVSLRFAGKKQTPQMSGIPSDSINLDVAH